MVNIMRKIFPIIFGLIILSNPLFSQCPVDGSFSYDSLEFDHSYYDASTNSIFAVGFYENSITINGVDYFPTDTNNVGKVIVNLDTLGNVINSWQSSQTQNIVGGTAGNPGYFNAGLVVTDNSVFIPYTYYSNELKSYIYSLEKYDKGGQPIWTYEIGSSPNTATRMGFDAIDIDSNGDIILTGVVQDTFINSSTGDSYGSPNLTNAFVMAVDTINLSINWFLPIQGSDNMELMGLATDNSGGIYVSGNSIGAESITIDNSTTNYTGMGSGFIFKIDVIDPDAGQISQPWINIFESSAEIEITALKYDFVHDYLHYASVDYAGGTDNTVVDTKIGAFNNGDGSVAWEHDMIIEGWYYLAYSSWISPNGESIYYAAWSKSGSQDFTRLKMDGTIIQDTLSSVATIQKFNTTTGNSELVTPTLYSFIGQVAVLPSGNVFAQANYSGSIGVETSIGKLNPSAYPFFFGLLVNRGGVTVGSADLEAITTQTTSSLSYQWYLDGNEITVGGNAKTYTPAEAGFYKVDISDENGCVFDTKSKQIFEAGGNSVSDSMVMVNLYRSTNPNDTAWFNSDGWLSAPLNTWFGVTLNAGGRVESLDLNNNNLYHNIPVSIGDLAELKILHLYGNKLSGSIPPSIGRLGALEELILHTNPLSGNIPKEIGDLNNLKDLRLSQTELTGVVPEEIGNLLNLKILYLGLSQYGGEIPTSLGNLTNLRELDLQQNFFEGSLPTELGNLTSLETFVAQNNNLSGVIPDSFESLTNLRYIDISINDFSGVLPDIIHLPNIVSIYVYNNAQLEASIPTDLDQLTQLRNYHIDATYPIGGEIPQVIFDATFMESYGLSAMKFTGTLTEANIAKLTNLTDLYISNNLLTGDVPQAFVDLANLRILNIQGNFFESLPDFGGSSSMQSLAVSNNQFQISDLAPNANKEFEFFYAPQSRIGANQELTPAPGSSFTITSEIEDFAGSSFQWIFNRDTLNGATNNELNISDFRIYNSGAYVLQATHPDLPDLLSLSGFINVKANVGKTKWFVDNDMNHTADFRDIYQAISATKSNDTIYIAGSEIPYQDADLFSNRVLLGPGYFLTENPNTQFNKVTAFSPFINITKDASGSQIYGMDIEILYLNNQSSRLPDTLQNVVLKGNKVGLVALGDKNNEIEIAGNYIRNLQINSTPLAGVFRSYDNISVHNNIIDSVGTLFSEIIAANNGLNNFVFENNTIGRVSDSINDVEFINNIIDVNLSGNSVDNGNINFSAANFVNASGTFSIDSDFITQDAALDKGAFGGNIPYILSGLPPVPAIYDVIVGPRLSLTVFAKNQDSQDINSLRYLYRKDNLNSNAFLVEGFNVSQDINVQFLPNRSALTAGESYEIVLVAIDQNGKRSHRTYVPYEAISASLSGIVVDVNAAAINNGDVKLFTINPFANKYDTAAVQQLEGSNSFDFQNLILGDYIILANPAKTTYPDLIPTYLGNTIDWELADTLRLQQNISEVRIEVEKLPTPPNEPQVGFVSGFFEEEYDDADSSLRQILPRKRISGTGVSVRRLGNSNRNSSLRLLQEDTELIAYTITNENGEYEIPDLPEGEYAIRFEYPGVLTDETSDVYFTVEDGVSESFQVDAKVENGKIVITNNTVVLANEKLNDLTISLFPNPADNYLTVGLSYSIGDLTLRMIDLKGRIVLESTISNTDNRIYIGDLEQGIYVVNLTNNQNVNINLKIIKK